MKQFVLILIFTEILFAVTGDDIIKKYSLANPQFSGKDFDESVCSILAESTFTYYNKVTGLIDSQYEYYNEFKANRVLLHYYDHEILDNNVRVTKEILFVKTTNDTLQKSLITFDKNGMKTNTDMIYYDYPRQEKEVFTYNNRNQETAYYYIHVKSNGTFDTAYVHKTTYDSKGRPVTKVFPKANGKDVFKYTDFDSVSAELAVLEGKELPFYVYFFNQNKKQNRVNEYSWSNDTLPLRRSICYFYDSLGRISKFLYFSSCDVLSYYSGPGTFCLNAVEYVKYDSKGRESEHYKRIRPDDKYKK